MEKRAMDVTGPQIKAARALVQWPRDHVARLAEIDLEILAHFETRLVDPGEAARARLAAVLEGGGAVFIGEDSAGGRGVRLKFTARDVKSINRLEGEGGPVGDDDV
jgi:hypothetical protein